MKLFKFKGVKPVVQILNTRIWMVTFEAAQGVLNLWIIQSSKYRIISSVYNLLFNCQMPACRQTGNSPAIIMRLCEIISHGSFHFNYLKIDIRSINTIPRLHQIRSNLVKTYQSSHSGLFTKVRIFTRTVPITQRNTVYSELFFT